MTAVGRWSAANAQSRTESVKAPSLFRIGFQKSMISLMLLKQNATLKERFPNTKLSWIEFPAGPQLLEALAVGSIDFGATGDAPPVFAQAAGKDFFYVGIEPPKPESSAILVAKDSPIRRLGDLKGKKIALAKGSSAHYFLVRAIEKAGLQWADIQPIYLAPSEARAAFEKGVVDAWVIWDPYYAAIELSPLAPRVLVNGREFSSNSTLYLSARPLAEQYPEFLEAMLSELTAADNAGFENRKSGVHLIEEATGLDTRTVSLFLERRHRSPVTPVNAEAIANQQRVADTFFKQGLIPKAIRVAENVWQPKSN